MAAGARRRVVRLRAGRRHGPRRDGRRTSLGAVAHRPRRWLPLAARRGAGRHPERDRQPGRTIDRREPGRPAVEDRSRHLAASVGGWTRDPAPAAHRRRRSVRADLAARSSNGPRTTTRSSSESCGEAACRYRLLPASGDVVTTIADPTLGTSVGLAAGHLVTYAACRGLPCPLVSVDIADRTRTTIHDAAGLAVLSRDEHGRSVIVHEIDADGGSLRSVGPDGGDATAPAERTARPPARRRSRVGRWRCRASGRPARSSVPMGACPMDGTRHALLRRALGRRDRSPWRGAAMSRSVRVDAPRRRDRRRPCRRYARWRRTVPIPASAVGSSARTRSSSSAGGQAPSRPAAIRNAILAAAADSNASRASKAATFRLRQYGSEPDRLRHRNVRRERARLLHPDRSDRLHDVAPRARPRLRLGHAALVPDAGDRRRTAATTPRPSRSTSSGTSRS